MELFYNLFLIIAHYFSFLMPATGLIFYYKFSVVFILFIINLYLFFTFNSSPLVRRNGFTHSPSVITNMDLSARVKTSGLNINNLKGLITYLGTIGGLLSAAITIKNELKDIQIGKLDQLMETERAEVRKSIDQDREEHQRILSSIENHRDDLNSIHVVKAKLVGHNDRLLTLHQKLKDNVEKYHVKSSDSDAKLSDLGILDQLIKYDTNKFKQELNSIVLNIENSPTLENNGENMEISATTSSDAEKPNIEIKESSINPLNFELGSKLEWFEGLNGIKKLAVCLIIGKGVIFSALISIIFIFYGNILIDKYDLINKYPKLAKLIQLRQKFQKYYFKYYCFLILLVVFSEIIFGIAVLTF